MIGNLRTDFKHLRLWDLLLGAWNAEIKKKITSG